MPLPPLLAGPIVRRLDGSSVSVWLALSIEASVTLKIWKGQQVSSPALPDPVATGARDTVQLGANLHVVVVRASLVEGASFEFRQTYAYDVEVKPAAGGQTLTLQSLGLLEDKTLDNGFPHLALGFQKNWLPSIVFPPEAVTDLRVLHASCRKPHDPGLDALRFLDDLVDPRTPPAEAPRDQRPHLLFLTGDQIYADDVAWTFLPLIDKVGHELVGKREKFSAQGGPFESGVANFPSSLRQTLMEDEAGFTSSEAHSHLMSFAEYAAMYLLCWSNELWETLPAFAAPSDSPQLPPSVRKELTAKRIEDRKKHTSHLPREVDTVMAFARGTAKVRRALANVPTFMIFDDHDVTDDWNITLDWQTKVLGKSVGKQTVRNALVAYTFFQGWGNDPASFDSGGDNAGLLVDGSTAIVPKANETDAEVRARAEAIARLERAFGLDQKTPTARWNFQILEDAWRFGFVVLDERTRRGFSGRITPAARIAPAALQAQVPVPVGLAGREVLFVVAPAPVLGLSLLEEVVQPAAARVFNLLPLLQSREKRRFKGQYTADVEPWSADPGALEQLFATLAPARRVVFLSGDVHFSSTAGLSYWTKGAADPVRFAQVTCSPSKNSADPAFLPPLIRAWATGQRLLRAGLPVGRIAWAAEEPFPLELPAGTSFGALDPELRGRFRREPVLAPAYAFPSGTTYKAGREPDWVWRFEPVFDLRPERARSADDRPPLPAGLDDPAEPSLEKYPAILRYHSDALTMRGLSRQQVWAHNVALVSLSREAPAPAPDAPDGPRPGRYKVRHTIFSPPVSRPETLEAITVHEVWLDPDPAGETKPGPTP